jgi:SAM-dependent methyltransferase
VDPAKLRTLLSVLRCTSCRSGELVAVGDDRLTCDRCGDSYPIVDGAVDFLDAATSLAFGIEETDNVSDHPFDGNAMTLINRARETGGLVLDCGSGFKSNAYDHVVQLEIVNYANVDVLAVNQLLPFADESFEVVFSADVLEHVDDPFGSASEIVRVLKPGGFVYIDLPFLQPEHGYPNHFFNATRQGLRRLFPTLVPVGHQVPLSGHPISSLRSLVAIYQAGLPERLWPEFLSLTIGDVLARTDQEWLGYSICSELGADSQWLIASTTQAVLRKDGGASPTGFDLEADDLPGFRRPTKGSRSTYPRPSPVPPAPGAGRPPAPSEDRPTLSEKEQRLIDAKRKLLAHGRALAGRWKAPHRG